MKQGMTIEALATEVARVQASAKDYRVDTRSMMLSSNGDSHQTIDGVDDELVVNDYAHGQIAGHLKIPKVYYDRLRGEQPTLLDTNVNTLLHATPTTQMIRAVDGRARAFLSDRYRRLDNFDLFQAVVPTLTEILGEAPGAHVESAGLTETKLWLTVILPFWTEQIQVGQTVKLGVRISNSEVGAGACAVETIIYTLECLNGMVVGKSLRRNHIGRRVEADEDLSIYRDETLRLDDQAFFAKVSDSVRACADEARFQQVVNELRDLAGIAVEEEPIKAVETLAKKIDLTEAEAAATLRHLVQGGDLSAWGYVSAVTRMAQDVESYDRSMELEKVGGRLAAGDLVATLPTREPVAA